MVCINIADNDRNVMEELMGTAIVLAVVIIMVHFAVKSIVRNKKAGKCGGGCAGCSGSCMCGSIGKESGQVHNVVTNKKSE